MADFNLTEPWAILFSGLATLVAALVVALLGPWMLNDRFENLNDAADKARSAAKEASEAILKVKDSLEKLDIETSALGSAVANVRNIVSDIADDQTVAAQPERISESANFPGGDLRIEDQIVHRDELRSLWNDIRAKVVDIATNPTVDGRKRAKYARIDGRNYRNVLDALHDDQLLVPNAQRFFEAFDIWSRYRANRAVVAENDVMTMRDLRNQIAGNV
jgi:predicted trehalose synthase